MWVECARTPCLASTTTYEGAMMGTLWLEVWAKECDLSEPPGSEWQGPSSNPGPL